MNQQIDYHQTISTRSISSYLTVLPILTVALGAGNIDASQENWVEQNLNPYSVNQKDSSFSDFTRKLEDTSNCSIDFAAEITQIISEFVERQQPLGREFEEIWDAHATDLYES